MRYQRDAIDFSKMTCIPLNGIGLDQRNQSVQSDFVRCLYVPGKTQNEKKHNPNMTIARSLIHRACRTCNISHQMNHKIRKKEFVRGCRQALGLHGTDDEVIDPMS